MTKTFIYFAILFLFFGLKVGYAQKTNLNLLPDTIGTCWGDTAKLEIKNNAIAKNATYQWITPYGFFDFYKVLPAKQSGKYFVRVRSGNNIYTDSCFVKHYSKPRLNFHDTSVCNTTQVIIDAKNPGCKYQWSNDETTQRLRIESQGRYWVKVNNKGCFAADTFFVLFNQGASPNFGSEVTFCLSDENKILSIKNVAGTKIVWSNGATGNSIVPTKDGTYWVKTSSALCGSKTDSVKVKLKACDCEILVPNSFTPNEDDKNDYFFPVLQCEYTYYNLTIVDRWQNPVYITNNISGKWDGRFKGNLCPDDIYFYNIETIEKITGKKLVRNGQVSLFR